MLHAGGRAPSRVTRIGAGRDGNSPQGVAVNAASAYVTNAGDGTVSVISTATNTVTTTISLSPAFNIALSPDGSTAYVTGASTVSAISTETNTVTGTIGGFFAPQAIAVTGPAGRPPAVTAVSPAHGPEAGGTPVTITGTGFTGATSVHFGAAAAAFTVNSDTQITATAPAGAALGPVNVTVTTPGQLHRVLPDQQHNSAR